MPPPGVDVAEQTNGPAPTVPPPAGGRPIQRGQGDLDIGAVGQGSLRGRPIVEQPVPDQAEFGGPLVRTPPRRRLSATTMPTGASGARRRLGHAQTDARGGGAFARLTGTGWLQAIRTRQPRPTKMRRRP